VGEAKPAGDVHLLLIRGQDRVQLTKEKVQILLVEIKATRLAWQSTKTDTTRAFGADGCRIQRTQSLQ